MSDLPDPNAPLSMEQEQDRERVAAVLRRIRSAARQRQAIDATLEGGSVRSTGRADELRRLESIREPEPFSHRPGLGRLVVAARKTVYFLFLRWAIRPILEQQNAFNAEASRSLQEALGESERLRERVRRLEVAQESAAASGSEPPHPSGTA